MTSHCVTGDITCSDTQFHGVAWTAISHIQKHRTLFLGRRHANLLAYLNLKAVQMMQILQYFDTYYISSLRCFVEAVSLNSLSQKTEIFVDCNSVDTASWPFERLSNHTQTASTTKPPMTLLARRRRPVLVEKQEFVAAGESPLFGDQNN